MSQRRPAKPQFESNVTNQSHASFPQRIPTPIQKISLAIAVMLESAWIIILIYLVATK